MSDANLMSVTEFEQAYPQYAFNMLAPLVQQTRIFDGPELVALPVELKPITERIRSSRWHNKVNRNQTKTHFQCAVCHRVLRNDHFRACSQHRDSNVLNSYCDECQRAYGRERSKQVASDIIKRRGIVWQYIAPQCALCGYNDHYLGMDMHHVGGKDKGVSDLITSVCNAKNTSLLQVERLCAEAELCVPLCAICHRMIHYGAKSLQGVQPLKYDPIVLINLLRDGEKGFQYNLAEAA